MISRSINRCYYLHRARRKFNCAAYTFKLLVQRVNTGDLNFSQLLLRLYQRKRKRQLMTYKRYPKAYQVQTSLLRGWYHPKRPLLLLLTFLVNDQADDIDGRRLREEGPELSRRVVTCNMDSCFETLSQPFDLVNQLLLRTITRLVVVQTCNFLKEIIPLSKQ